MCKVSLGDDQNCALSNQNTTIGTIIIELVSVAEQFRRTSS